MPFRSRSSSHRNFNGPHWGDHFGTGPATGGGQCEEMVPIADLRLTGHLHRQVRRLTKPGLQQGCINRLVGNLIVTPFVKLTQTTPPVHQPFWQNNIRRIRDSHYRFRFEQAAHLPNPDEDRTRIPSTDPKAESWFRSLPVPVSRRRLQMPCLQNNRCQRPSSCGHDDSIPTPPIARSRRRQRSAYSFSRTRSNSRSAIAVSRRLETSSSAPSRLSINIRRSSRSSTSFSSGSRAHGDPMLLEQSRWFVTTPRTNSSVYRCKTAAGKCFCMAIR